MLDRSVYMPAMDFLGLHSYHDLMNVIHAPKKPDRPEFGPKQLAWLRERLGIKLLPPARVRDRAHKL